MTIFSAIIPVSIKANNHQNLIQWLSTQDYTKVEVIVVLDATDVSSELKTETRNSFLPFAIKILSDNFGSPGFARNAGLTVSESEWITFWDADDLPLIGNFQQMVQEANQNGFNVCAGDYILRNLKSGATKFRKLPQSEYMDALPTLLGNDPGIWRFAFRKEVLKRKFTPIRMAEDQIFLMENNVLDQEIYLGHKFVYCYFYGGKRQSTSNKNLIQDLRTAITISTNYLSTHYASPQSQFASVLLARQLLTATKRGSLKLKFWALLQALKNLVQVNLGLKSFFRGSFEKPFLRNGSSCKHVYVPLTGGLGNQLFQLAYALNKSKDSIGTLISNLGAPRLNHIGAPELLSYQIFLEVDELKRLSSNWLVRKSSGYMLRAGVSPTSFDELPVVRHGAQFLWKCVLRASWGKKITPLAAVGVGFFESNSTNPSNFDYGYFQSYKWPDLVKSELQSLKLSETSIALLRYTILASKERPLIVHVRLGDYRNESNFGFPGLSYYSKAISLAWDTGNFRSIWVFSDEIDTAREVLPPELMNYYRLIEDTNLSSAEVLEIMRLGEGYVIANSTFSWWGAYLSKSNNPLVIAPKPWFSKVESPKDLIPETWITIETVQSENNFMNFERE
jgi:glycosyltransferase involved in cell wall biosynthesis